MDIAALERLGFEITLGAYLISSILFILYLSTKKRRLLDMGFTLVSFGFAFQTLALITRWFYAVGEHLRSHVVFCLDYSRGISRTKR
jgi:polyferredoxin